MCKDKKECKKCQDILPLTQFHKHKGFKDGHRSVCKYCTKIMSQKYYKENSEEQKARIRRWREKNREKYEAYVKRTNDTQKERKEVYNKKYPYKVKAGKMLGYAIYKGRVKKRDQCQLCGTKEAKIVGHHFDYSKPLEVTWLCEACHNYIHRKISPAYQAAV